VVKAARGLGLHAEFGFHFSEGEAGDAEDFLAGEITAEDGDGATRQAEFVGEKFAEYGGGAALDGRGVDLDLQGVAEPAAHHAARSVGDGFDGEGAGGEGGCGRHGVFSHGWTRINTDASSPSRGCNDNPRGCRCRGTATKRVSEADRQVAVPRARDDQRESE